MNELEREGILITANYNRMKYDRTKWYTVDYDRLEQVTGLDFSNRPTLRKEKGQNDRMVKDDVTKPIPETNTEKTSYTNSDTSSKTNSYTRSPSEFPNSDWRRNRTPEDLEAFERLKRLRENIYEPEDEDELKPSPIWDYRSKQSHIDFFGISWVNG